MNIAQTLNDYLEALQKRGLSAALNPAASIEEIKYFESEHGLRLPEAFIQLYQKFNGQMNELIPPSEPRWLGLEEIFSKQQDWQDFCHTHYGKQWQNLTTNSLDSDGLVKNTLFHPFWLPFMADDGGFYCLDYDPDHSGQVAQVIYVNLQTTLEKTYIVHLANQFSTWLENHVQAFQSRRTVVSLETLLEEYLVHQKANTILSLNPPADFESIDQQQKYLMVNFPPSLKKIWSTFNGYQQPDPLGGDYWIPLEQIESVQKEWRENLAKKLGTDPEKSIRPMAESSPTIKPYYYNPFWIPIYKNQTVIIALDFNPTDEGEYGQPLVIYNQFDYLIHSDTDTFDEWLYRFLSYYLYPENDEGDLAHSDMFTSEISQHYQYYLGIPDGGFDIQGSPFDLHLLWFSAVNRLPISALLTCGNFHHQIQNEKDEKYSLEFLMLLPNQEIAPKWALNMLTMASQGLQENGNILTEEYCLFPHGKSMTAFEGVDFKGFLTLTSKNNLLPKNFYEFSNNEGQKIKILLVIPLYEDEINYALKDNLVDLINVIREEKIEELANPKRKSLI